MGWRGLCENEKPQNIEYSQGVKHLPSSLRVLGWFRYPSYSLPPNFYPEELVMLELSQSCLILTGFLDNRKASPKFFSLTLHILIKSILILFI